jgi:hypothetical protein
VLKLDEHRLEFVVADLENLLEAYNDNGVDKIRVNLPIVNNNQTVIPHAGAWRVSLFNYREAERQSISKVLRPKADL